MDVSPVDTLATAVNKLVARYVALAADLAMGEEVLDHLEAKHDLWPMRLSEAAQLFRPDGAVRPRKHTVLVTR